MKTTFAALFLLCATTTFGQTCGIAPVGVQFFGTNGQPLSGGFVVTDQAGTTTPATTYADGSCTSTLPNPVPLDSSGRPYAGSGGVTGIWLQASSQYKFILEDSSMSVIWTLDNISAAAGGGGSSTNYWTLSGSTISNNNAGGTGPVSVGGQLTVGTNIYVTSGLNLQDNQASANYAVITAPSCVGTLVGSTCTGANTTWRWPGFDMAGVLTSDGMGNLSFQPGGGGGGGSAVGPTGAVQLQGGGGAFTGSGNLTYVSQLLTATATSSSSAGIAVATGYIQADAGLLVTSGVASSWQNVNVPTGGVYAQSLYGINYTTTGTSSGAPSPTTGQPAFSGSAGLGSLYCDTGTSPCVEKLWNGSAWISLATGGATSPGGSNCDAQFNSAGSFGGSANFTWNCASTPQELVVTASSSASAGIAVGVGYIQSDSGFLVTSGVSPSWQNIQAPTGGVYARNLYATTYTTTGTSNTPPLPTNGQPAFSGTAGLGTLYCNTSVTPCVETLWNGVSWTALGSGGGGGTPGGPANSIQTNNAGSFGGASNFVAPISGGAVTQVTLANASFVTQGNTAGFDASQCGQTSFISNCIQAPFGGVTALNGIFGGPHGLGPDALSIVGTSGTGSSQRASMSFDTAGGSILWELGQDVNENGGNDFYFTAVGAPALSITGNHATGNLGILTTASATTGQALTVAGVANVAGISLSNGYIQSGGGLLSLSTNNNSVQSLGGFSAFNTSGAGVGSCAYAINTNCVIDTSRDATVVNLTITGGCTGCTSGSFLPLAGGTMTGSIVMSSGTTVNSLTTGATVAFQAGSGDFQAFGNGNINGANINALSSFEINGTTAINNLLTFFPSGIIDSGGATIGGTLGVTGVTTANAGLISHAAIGATAYNIVNGSGAFLNGGVTCSGTPTSSFASVSGIVTHC